MRPRLPVLHLTTGLPGTGKTTLARQIEHRDNAIRLTPDEWMQPLFGESDAGGRRDILEGRLVWVAYRAALSASDAILDFGCWSPDERYAVRAIAALAGGTFALHYLTLEERERRRRAEHRWRTVPHETFEMSEADHDRFLAAYQVPTEHEMSYAALPPPPAPFGSWTAWAADRWPTLPDLGEPAPTATGISRADLSDPALRTFLQAHLDELEPTAPPESRHALDVERLGGEGIRLFVCRVAGEIVATGALARLGAGHEEIKSMRVAPAARGRGHGRSMLAFLLADADNRGVERLSLETGSMDFFAPARRLYVAAGFTPTGPFASYVADPNSCFLTRLTARPARP